MKRFMENKFLLLFIAACILLTAWFVFVAIHALNGPVSLTDEELTYYVEVAETVWHDNSRPRNPIDDSTIKYDLRKDNVTVSSYNIFKETVTVYFNEAGNEVVVNGPNISFIGCFIFHIILATGAISCAIWLTVLSIQDIIACRKEREKRINDI